MNLSDYAQMLYPSISGGLGAKNRSEYMISLTNLIIEEPQDSDKEKLNPLTGLGTSMLEKIYRGQARIKPEYAGTILSNSDSEEFKSYLLTLSPDALNSIGGAMQKFGIDVSKNDAIAVATVCSKLFISVLEDCAKGEKPTKKKDAPSIDTPCKEMVEAFKKSFDYFNIKSLIDKDPGFIHKSFFNKEDMLLMASRFVAAIESDVMVPFERYSDDLVYINIKRFISLTSEYKRFSDNNIPQSPIEYLGLIDAHRLFLEKEADRYRNSLKDLYTKICGDDAYK